MSPTVAGQSPQCRRPRPQELIGPELQLDAPESLLPEFEKKQIAEIWINPGAESDELMAEASRRKLNVIYACSIIGIGRNPSQF